MICVTERALLLSCQYWHPLHLQARLCFQRERRLTGSPPHPPPLTLPLGEPLRNQLEETQTELQALKRTNKIDGNEVVLRRKIADTATFATWEAEAEVR
jgi:hypothetical protein